MPKGRIQELTDRGFGFIKPDDSSERVFFHATALQGELRFDALKVGMPVEFGSEQGQRGPRAKFVQVLIESREEYRFLNPYNFIRTLGEPQNLESHLNTRYFNKTVPPPHDRWVGLSGRLTCELTTITPLFVSDPDSWYANGELKDKDELHKSYRFFSYDGNKPFIPASSLRGMIRNVFEASTNSCFAHLDYGARLSYRLPPHEALKLVPARVRYDGEWRLQLLLGTATLAIGEPPRGDMYPGMVRQYESLDSNKKRGGTHHKNVDINDFVHGSKCYALVKKPRSNFPPNWIVLHVSSSKEQLLQKQESDQRIFEGYLCITNQNIDNKSKERFFISDTDNGEPLQEILLSGTVRERYEELIQDYQDRHQKDMNTWLNKLKTKDKSRLAKLLSKRKKDKNGKIKEVPVPAYSRHILIQKKIAADGENQFLQHGDLVYVYLEKGQKARFIAPVSIPRVCYENKTYLKLPRSQWKCDDYEQLCPACRTFGWTEGRPGMKEEKKNHDRPVAYASRVRFTHARIPKEASYRKEEPITLAILSSPKPTTSRFYLMPAHNKPESKEKQPDRVVNYDAPDMIIRGRKMYRHHGKLQQQELWRAGDSPKRDEQNRTIHDAVGKNTIFTFEIDFENISEVELGALLWSLELEESMYHRLGLAKPLGLGSVKIEVSEIEMRDPKVYHSLLAPRFVNKTEQKGNYISLFKDAFTHAYAHAGKEDFLKMENIQDLNSLLKVSQPELPVHYPRSSEMPSEEGKNFEWFMGNKRHKRGPGYLLPLAVDDKNGFPLLDKFGNPI